MKALAQYGAEVIALSRTQADLDSLKNEVNLCKENLCREWNVAVYVTSHNCNIILYFDFVRL